MIFDSERFQDLRAKYASTHPIELPRILKMAEHNPSWKEHLEEIIHQVPEPIQKDWLNRLLNEKDEQCMGAWFEMMLYGWLQQVGDVSAHPHEELEKSEPDFLLRVGDQEIFIEAFVLEPPPEDRRRKAFIDRLLETLRTIPLPFFICIEQIEFQSNVSSIPWEEFRVAAEHWLNSEPSRPLEKSYPGCNLILRAFDSPGYLSVESSGPVEIRSVTVDSLRNRLQEKAKQHKGARTRPFVLAVLSERPELPPEEAVFALFGYPQLALDPTSGKVLQEGIDQSGLHYYKGEITYTTLSGTLYFYNRNVKDEPPFLPSAYYIQNPYAQHPIDPDMWPVASRFVVFNTTDSDFEMAWK